MKYVIIGNSTAATFAIEGIRAVDRAGSITVISDESRPAYGRPLISYYLYGRIRLENTAYQAPSDLVPPGTWYYRVTAQTQDGRTAQAMNKICVQDIYYPGVDMAEVP